MIKKIAGGFVILVVALVLLITLQPADFQVERSTQIATAPEVPFALVNDLHQWEQWSPWAKLDPAMEITYGGSDAGVGATYAWSGNSDVGAGKMTITKSTPGEEILIDLEFLKPFEAQNTTVFSFAAEGDATKVTWRMNGTNNFMGKAMGLFMDMDRMIGESFEQGLADLKTLSETKNPSPAA